MTTPGSFDPDLVDAFGSAYELQRELSGGGMSRVFVAIERSLNREIVIKVLPADLAAGVNRDRFRREIQVAAQLQHPHIVPLHSAGAHGDVLFYTMPYIDGESLKHALQAGERFSLRDVLRILHDVTDALAYAHERGVVHRDIKPANVLRSGAHAVVTDFGVAKAISAALPAIGMTTSGMAIGTPAYMAPEQIAGDPAADHRMDIYAVGLLAYELITREMPFAGPSPQATMAAQLTRNPIPLAQLRADVPEPLSALVAKCLSKAPADRPQSARELCSMLEAITMSSGDYPPLAERSRKWPLIVAGGATGLLVVAAAWGLSRRGAPPPNAPAVARVAAPASAGSAVAPRVITHADSVAIAKAFDRRVGGGRNTVGAAGAAASSESAGLPRTPAGANPARLSARGGRGNGPGAPNRPAFVTPFVDSVARVALVLSAERSSEQFQPPAATPLSAEAFAERAATLGPQRHVLIVAPPPAAQSRADSVAALLAVQIRKTFTSPPGEGRYALVDNPSGQSAMQSVHENTDSLARVAGADINISFISFPARDSSISVTVLVRDLTATSAYAVRSTARRVTRDSVAVSVDAMAQATRKLADQMDRAPRADAIDPRARAFTQRAAELGGKRRVVIANHAPADNPAIQESGSAVMDVVRWALATSSRFVPVSRDSTLSMLERTRDIKTVLTTLNADMMVSIRGDVDAAGSMTWTVTVRDQTAIPAYSQRSVSTGHVPVSAPLSSTAHVVSEALEALNFLDHAPRAAAKP